MRTFDVEAVALLDARPQIALDQHQCHVAGSQHGIGVGHVAGLHLFEQDGALRRGAGIAARAVQTGDQPDRLDPRRLHPGGHGQLADQPRVRLGRLGLLRTLRPHGRPVEPGTAANADQGGARRKQKKMPTFHASLHSVSREKSRRREKTARHSAGRLKSHSAANNSDFAGRVKRRMRDKGKMGKLEKGQA